MPRMICPHCGREGQCTIVRSDPDGKTVYKCQSCKEEFRR